MPIKETTAKFKVDISELKSGIQEANRQIRLANAEFKAASSGMDDWSKSADGLSAKIKQLETVLDGENKKLDSLKSQLQLTEKEYGSNSKAADELRIKIANQQATINKTERSLSDFRSQLNDVEKSSDKGADGLKEFGDEAKKAESSSSSLASTLGGALKKGLVAIGTAAAGAITGFLASGEASKEYIEDMGKLEAAFTSSGHSAETAQEAYKGMVGILGETDQSVEAVNHLAKLTTNEKELAKWTDIAAGVYATFGDSLPIEGLTEAANETAKVGKVTGPLADALNWAGISEDKFNESLEKCNSEQERATLITNTLNKTYDEAANKYKEVNADLIESRRATSDMNAAMAEMGKVAMPITTALKDGFTKLLKAIVELIGEADIEAFTDSIASGFQFIIDNVLPPIKSAISWVIDNKDAVIAGIAGIGAAMMTMNVANMIMGVVKSFKAFKAAQEGATVAQWLLNAAMNANPIGLVVAAIVGLITAFVLLWKKCDAFREFWIGLWDAMKKGVKIAIDAIAKFFSTWLDNMKRGAKIATEAVKNFFSNLKDGIINKWNNITDWFSKKWNGIKDGVKELKENVSDSFKKARDGVSNAWNSVGDWFSDKWKSIKNAFKNVKKFFSDSFSDAWKGVKNAFSNVGSFFGGIWDTIKEKFSSIGTKVGDAIGGTFKSAINSVIATVEKGLNLIPNAVNGAIGAINKLPGVEIDRMSKISLPRLYEGTVTEKGKPYLIEGSGDEAVVPLHNNKKWIRKTSQDLKQSLKNEGLVNGSNSQSVVNNNYNFTQNNNSPKALSRLEIYRQTKNQLLYAKGV